MKTLRWVGLAVLFLICAAPCLAAEDVVVASSFGYDAQDATECLQKAIDSGAKKVVVDKQSGPWLVRPIALRSNLELVLEEGTEIFAKEGEFKSKGECLLCGNRVENVTIRGEGAGASLRMRKRDYWDAPYEKSEWRHALSLLSSSNVTIKNLTIKESGGDGIYLGVSAAGVPCRNITIKKVDCVANNRQGVSVISVDGLLMEDCRLRDTFGTAPQAGIDFEPNKADEQITNVVMRRVLSIDNKGDGFAFYLPNLSNETGKELSITVENCQSVRNGSAGMSLTVANGEKSLLNGAISFKDSHFICNPVGISIRSKWADGAPITFDQVSIVTPSAAKATHWGQYAHYDFYVVPAEEVDKHLASTVESGVSLIAVGTDLDANGGIEFNDLAIYDACESAPKPLLLLRDASSEGVGFKKISGEITSIEVEQEQDPRDYKVVKTALNDEALVKMFPELKARRVPAYDLAGLNADEKTAKELADAWRDRSKNGAEPQSVFRTRGNADYYFYAEAGEKVSWNVQERKIGNYEPGNIKISIKTPSGKETELDAIPNDLKAHDAEYVAEETGWHSIALNFGASAVELRSTCDVPVLASSRPNLNLISTVGTFSFYVPEDAEDLGLRVVGSPAERVTVTIFDPSGAQVAKLENVAALGTWSNEVDENGTPKKPASGFWTVKFEKPTVAIMEDYAITLLGVPALMR